MKTQTKKSTAKKKSAPVALASKPAPRGKAAKIAVLKRSAAAKARWHRLSHQRQATHHFGVLALAIAVVLCVTSVVVATASNLVPPSGQPIDADVYIRAAQANKASGIRPADQSGQASWYALGLRAPDALTCASRQFPRGSYLEVTDLRNGKKVTCLVNDYGPTAGTNRIIDLSRGSYSQLEGLGSGTLPAEVRVTQGP